MKISALLLIMCLWINVRAQVIISDQNAAPDSSAMLEVRSGSKGFLPPRMNPAQRDAIVNPAEGLIIYNTEEKTLEFYNGVRWMNFYYPPSDKVTCGKEFMDADGHTYKTVQIGAYCWMAENLNKGIRLINSTSQTNNGTIEKYCYNNLEANCNLYGGLYQWNEMMQYSSTPSLRGICPEGWQLPDMDQYMDLINFLGGSGVAGGKMKTTGTVESGTGLWHEPNSGATNISGFSALPGGTHHISGVFTGIHDSCRIWSSSGSGATQAEFIGLDYQYQGILTLAGSKTTAMSVRCIKSVNQPPAEPSDPSPSNGSQGLPVDTTLSWSCSDPENDPLTFDVYFGTDNPPPLVASGLSVNSFNPTPISNSTYYWKIVAHDPHGHSTPGPIWTLVYIPWGTCNYPFFDLRDWTLYSTIQIGSQCWLKSNLKFMPSVSPPDLGSLSDPYYYVFGYEGTEVAEAKSTSTFGTYGVLYNLAAAQISCPYGWHLPSDEEWCTLTTYLDATVNCSASSGWTGIDVGNQLKEAGDAHWYVNLYATNSSKFTALPGGCRSPSFNFNDMSTYGYWWTSSGSPTMIRELGYYQQGVSRNHPTTDYGFSVRCIKN